MLNNWWKQELIYIQWFSYKSAQYVRTFDYYKKSVDQKIKEIETKKSIQNGINTKLLTLTNIIECNDCCYH